MNDIRVIKIKHRRDDNTVRYTYACSKCSKAVNKYFNYCPYCGSKLCWENIVVYEKKDE